MQNTNLTPKERNSRGFDAGLTRRQALGALSALALPWNDLFAQNATTKAGAAATPATVTGSPMPPDLANLHPVIQWMADEQRPLHLSFLDQQWRDLESWKAKARPFFREQLSYNPKGLPVKADVVRREERDGFTIEVLKLHATPAYHIPARVLVPT